MFFVYVRYIRYKTILLVHEGSYKYKNMYMYILDKSGTNIIILDNTKAETFSRLYYISFIKNCHCSTAMPIIF